MACILKFPASNGRGVLSITDRERDALLPGPSRLRESIVAMSSRWLVGLHHNWHDLDYMRDPLFAFSLAGEHDLRERNGAPLVHIPMDAANFAPPCFRPSDGERHWDLLLVARAVYFKELPEAFQLLRALLDRGHVMRTLIVCPVPETAEPTTVDVEELFRATFSASQQAAVTLLAFRYRYPFPLDLQTLAFLYRSAKVCVYFASEERRPRNVAYAWAAGLPVVARSQIGLMLPVSLRRPPFFFEFEDADGWLRLIPEVIAQASSRPDMSVVAELFSDAPAVTRLVHEFESRGLKIGRDGWTRTNLGIRIARHHGLPAQQNALRMSLAN